MSAVEALLEQDWKPKRTVIMAFGFDEETGGVRGAAKIAEALEKTWGKDGVAFILDEGGMGLTTVGEIVYARPGVTEKGYMDAVLTLETAGDHSSRPPPHSGIGIMAEMIVALESHPYQPILTKENPLRGYLECQAKYTPGDLEHWLRRGLERDDDGKDIGRDLAEARGPSVRFSMQTSQAVDIIRGGDKVNALPETVSATVNYRIAPHDSLEVVKSNIEKYLEPIALRHNITVSPFDNATTAQSTLEHRSSALSAGALYLDSSNDLPPSPITPTDLSNPIWATFSATIRQVFESTPTLEGKKVVPVGDIMQGNTDTIQYWNLTKNIYRFSPAREGTRFGIHTIDEHIEMQAHLEGLRFYYDVIRNFDAADL
ncbi:Gly-Xaa carboxypeptidase, partial [Lecanoromycetidae sp. Uapishka_2]